MPCTESLIDDQGHRWEVTTAGEQDITPSVVIPVATVQFYDDATLGKIARSLVPQAIALYEYEREIDRKASEENDRLYGCDAKYNTSQPGFVYLLKAGPYYKIGVAKKVSKRIERLATLPPFDIELICTISTVDMYTLESDLHIRFAAKRKNGEWFELSPTDVQFIKEMNNA